MGLLKSGTSILVWGHVSGKDARLHQFDSGKCVANFSVCYGRSEGDNGGQRSGKFLDVKVWNNAATSAACLEKGDSVLIAGELKKEKKPDRDGRDRWYIDAEFFTVQPIYAGTFDNDVPEAAPPEMEELPDDDDGEYPECLR